VASDYLYRGIAETGVSDTNFRAHEALLHKGALPVNTIGPKVHLTPGSISVAVDRLLGKGLVSRRKAPMTGRCAGLATTVSRTGIPPGFQFKAGNQTRLELEVLSASSQLIQMLCIIKYLTASAHLLTFLLNE
jgi:hypothetical protein